MDPAAMYQMYQQVDVCSVCVCFVCVFIQESVVCVCM